MSENWVLCKVKSFHSCFGSLLGSTVVPLTYWVDFILYPPYKKNNKWITVIVWPHIYHPLHLDIFYAIYNSKSLSIFCGFLSMFYFINLYCDFIYYNCLLWRKSGIYPVKQNYVSRSYGGRMIVGGIYQYRYIHIKLPRTIVLWWSVWTSMKLLYLLAKLT